MNKILLLFFLVFLSFGVNAQVFTQTYVDKCTGEIKTVITTPMPNGMVMVAFYNQIRTFSNAEVNNGTVQRWLNEVYLDYSSRPCPAIAVVQQTVQQTVEHLHLLAVPQVHQQLLLPLLVLEGVHSLLVVQAVRVLEDQALVEKQRKRAVLLLSRNLNLSLNPNQKVRAKKNLRANKKKKNQRIRRKNQRAKRRRKRRKKRRRRRKRKRRRKRERRGNL